MSAVYGVLYSLCHLTLKNRLEVEAEYKAMVTKQRFSAMILHKLIQKICNGSTAVVVEDIISSMLEGLCNFMLVKWEDYATLPKYLEASEHKYQVLKETGFELALGMIRNSYIEELSSRGETESPVYKALEGWKDAASEVDLDKRKIREEL